jgi:hypothetical protein
MICTLLCSSTIFSGLSSQSSILNRDLIMNDAYAQEGSEEGVEGVDEVGDEESPSPTSDEEQSPPPPPPPANIAPIAVASAFPQNAKSNQLVTLDGSLSSDPDNGPQPLKYSWTLVSGAPGGGTITLQPNANDGLPTFTAPQVLDSSLTLRFQLVVNDGQMDSAPAYVDVTVSPEDTQPPSTAATPAPAPDTTTDTTTAATPPPSADDTTDATTTPSPSDNNATAIAPPPLTTMPPSPNTTDATTTPSPSDTTTTTTTASTANATLTVITKIGGTVGAGAPSTAQPSDFTIRVYASNSNPFESQGSESGTTVSFDANSRYEVEVYRAPPGYFQTFSGDCSGNIDPADQTPKVCTITNTFVNNVEFTSTLRVNVNINPTPPEPLDFQIRITGTPASPAKYGVVMNDARDIRVVGGNNYEVIAQQPVKGFSVSYNATLSDGCKGTLFFQEVKECTITYVAAPQEANRGKVVVTGKVINDNQGKQTIFDIQFNGNTPTPSSFKTGDGTVTEVFVNPGQYNVTQQQVGQSVSNYTTTFSGDCNSTAGAGTIAAGELKFCTIIFNDAPPGGLSKGTLYVATEVNNDGWQTGQRGGGAGLASGSKSEKDFTIQVTGNNPSPSLFNGASSAIGRDRITGGTTVILDPGTYSVHAPQDQENTGNIRFPDGQRYSVHFERACQNIEIKAGEEKTCIVWFADEPLPGSRGGVLNMVVFGDSVAWGQGLLEQQKFHTIVGNEIKARYPSITINKQNYAHTGADIGGSASAPIPYLFRWDDVPGQDSQKLRDHIAKINTPRDGQPPDYWKTAPVEKLDDGRTIKVGPADCIVPPRGGPAYACKTVYIRLDYSSGTATLEGTGMLLRKLPGKYIDGKLTMFENTGLVNNFIFGGHRYHGEIPHPVPTILYQVEQYRGPPEPNKVNLILIDGCINDVGATTRLIDDQISHNELVRVIHNACYSDMKTLLQKVSSKFPNARVIVTGYFPAISEHTIARGTGLLSLLSGDITLRGPGTISSGVNTNIIISHWALFHRDSAANLAKAVQEVDPTSKRIFFVDPKFGPENSVFGPRALLYHFEGSVADWRTLRMVDSTSTERIQACNRELPEDTSLSERIGCYMASIAHPTPDGAKQYAREIMKVLDSGVLANYLTNTPLDPPPRIVVK